MLLTKDCLTYMVYVVKLLAVSNEADTEVSKSIENCKKEKWSNQIEESVISKSFLIDTYSL